METCQYCKEEAEEVCIACNGIFCADCYYDHLQHNFTHDEKEAD